MIDEGTPSLFRLCPHSLKSRQVTEARKNAAIRLNRHVCIYLVKPREGQPFCGLLRVLFPALWRFCNKFGKLQENAVLRVIFARTCVNVLFIIAKGLDAKNCAMGRKRCH